MSSNVPPFNWEKAGGKNAIHRVKLPKCDHSAVEYKNNGLLCPKCGAGFTGPRLDELYKMLRKE